MKQRIEIEIKNIGSGTYYAYADGRNIACANVVDDGHGDYLTSVFVEKPYRRQGIAMRLYRFIEDDLGRDLRPNPHSVTPDGQAFWARYSARRSRRHSRGGTSDMTLDLG